MQKKSTSKISIIAASALTLGTCLPASIAFADPDPVDPPSVGGQSGAGSTAMTMVWEDSDQEYGGTEDPNNPPSDPNDPTSPGENLAFKAPTAINFVAKANGDLIAPSYSAVYLENLSSFGIHVSSMQVEQGTGWNIVEDAASSANTANAVWGSIGPYNERLNWYDHKLKADVTTASKWGMAATGAANNQSKLFLATEGKFANLNIDLSEAKTFGTIHWYLKMGGEGQRAVDPATIHALNKPTTASANGSFKLKSSPTAAAAEDLGEAVEGDTVYIVAEPNQGYIVDEMSVENVSDNSTVTVTPDPQNENIGSFTMPNGEVDVDVTFKSAYGTVSQTWDAGVVENTVTATLYDSGALVFSGNGAMKNFEQFGQPWYSSRSSVTSVVIEAGVTSIGKYAVSYCTNLTSVVIPDSVTSIGNDAFYSCGNLTSVTIPDSVTSIGNDAFYGCSNLTSVAISNGVTSIGTYAFQACTSLTSITIPDGVTFIKSGTFSNCTNLTSVTIPDSVTDIGQYAFVDCTNLTSFTIPDGVTSIQNYAFQNCSSLTSVTIPDSVTSIGRNTFENCTNLTTINCGFAQYTIANAPWGAPNNPTINYNYAG